MCILETLVTNRSQDIGDNLVPKGFGPRFEKNDRANISAKEKEALQCIAQDLLARTVKDLNAQVEDGTLQEICNDH